MSGPLANARQERSYYVYFLIDPRDYAVFYVGKGCGRRMRSHAREVRRGLWRHNGVKCARIDEIQKAGLNVIEHVSATGLNEAEAFALERAEIAERKHALTNQAHGIVTARQSASEQASRLIAHAKSYREWVETASPGALACVREVFGHPVFFYGWYVSALANLRDVNLKSIKEKSNGPAGR